MQLLRNLFNLKGKCNYFSFSTNEIIFLEFLEYVISEILSPSMTPIVNKLYKDFLTFDICKFIDYSVSTKKTMSFFLCLKTDSIEAI